MLLQAGGDGLSIARSLQQSISGITLAPNTTLTLEPMPRVLDPAVKHRGSPGTAGGLLRQSSDEGLIPAWRQGASVSEGMPGDGSDYAEGGGLGLDGGGRPLLEVGFENLSMTLKSCGKQVLQGITGG